MPVTAKREEVKRGSANDMRIMEAITDATDGLTAYQIMAKLKISKKAAYGRLAFLVEQDVIKVTDAAKRGGAKTFTMKPSMLAPQFVQLAAESAVEKKSIRLQLLGVMPKDGKELHRAEIFSLIGITDKKKMDSKTPILSGCNRKGEVKSIRRGYYSITPLGILALKPKEKVELLEEAMPRWTATMKTNYTLFLVPILKESIARYHTDNIGFSDDFMDCYRWAERKVLMAAARKELIRQPKNLQALYGLAHNTEAEIRRVQEEELAGLMAEKKSEIKIGDPALCTVEQLVSELFTRGRSMMAVVESMPHRVHESVTGLLANLSLQPAASPVHVPAPVLVKKHKIGIVGLHQHEMDRFKMNPAIQKAVIDGRLELIWHADHHGKVSFRPDFAGVVVSQSAITPATLANTKAAFKRCMVAQVKSGMDDLIRTLLESLEAAK